MMEPTRLTLWSCCGSTALVHYSHCRNFSAEIEESLKYAYPAPGEELWVGTTEELLEEVRRLKREVHLLNLSRGVPSLVGMD